VDVAVVGAGIAGLSVAAFLSRAGFAATVYEQAAELRDSGAGIQLSPNGTRLLHRIGLAPHLSRVAVAPEAIEIRRWRDGATIARTDLSAGRYGAPYLTLHRADLYGGLLGAAPRVRTGRRCVAVCEYPDHAVLRFADGTTESADLVVGADGLHSVVRGTLAADKVRYRSFVAYRGVLPGTGSTVDIWLGASRHVVAYPMGRGEINVVRVEPDSFKSTFAGWHPEVRAILEKMTPAGRWPLYDRAPLTRWRTRRVVVVGDAAHPLLPFGAQGANQAVEDAAALAACLRADPADVPGALHRYERVRMPRLRRVAAMVRDNAVNHHLPDGIRQWVRDARPPDPAWLYDHDAEELA
jgi:salicylate hydroxylase